MSDVDRRVGLGQLVGGLAGTVWGIVVEYGGLGGRRGGLDLANQRCQIAALVVRRQRHEDPTVEGGGRRQGISFEAEAGDL